MADVFRQTWSEPMATVLLTWELGGGHGAAGFARR